MPELPWRGYWIAVDAAGRVWWVRCAVCNRELTRPDSQARGIGPDCLADVPEDEQADALEHARKLDRHLWRSESGLSLPASRFVCSPKARRQLVKLAELRLAQEDPNRVVKPTPQAAADAIYRLHREDPDAAARWRVFEEAKRRAKA